MVTDKAAPTLGSVPDGVYPHQDLTRQIIAAAYEVHRELGWGFLEKVYENALALELRSHGLDVRAQAPIAVDYKGERVGDYFADLLVNNAVLCEIKSAESLSRAHQAQLLHYLRRLESRSAF